MITNGIYTYKGKQDILLKEKFAVPKQKQLELFIWRSIDGSLGFNVDDDGNNFLKHLISETYTILLPTIIPIEGDGDITENINNFKGVSFLNNTDVPRKEYEQYLLFKTNEKKNRLLKKYNRRLIENQEPSISSWYINKRYTEQFDSFVEKYDLEYIIWSFSDFGIYFFHTLKTNSVLEKVKKICSTYGYPIHKVSDIRNMPYH